MKRCPFCHKTIDFPKLKKRDIWYAFCEELGIPNDGVSMGGDKYWYGGDAASKDRLLELVTALKKYKK